MSMPYQYTLLWTDALIYLLIIAIIAFIFWVRKREYLRAPWRQVAYSRLGTISAVILFAYSLIGLLDCIHFHPKVAYSNHNQTYYSSQTISLLDILIKPLGQEDEQTYSAPFALRTFGQDSQALLYAGRNLKNPQQRTANIIYLSIRGLIQGLILWLIISAIIFFWIRHREKKSGPSAIAWREVIITLGFILLTMSVAFNLASEYHILGTDKVGEDVFYLSIKSIRTGLIIGTLTTLFMLPFAVFLGSIAGYFGGWMDDVIQYVYTTLSSIPAVLLITAAILSLQIYISNHPELFPNLTLWADARLLALCAILGITGWTYLCRLLRGETLKLREFDFVHAALTMGASNFKIISRHILPNVAHIILITVVLDFSSLVLAEAVLSYVGVGVDPTTISWGNMINNARLELAREPVVWWPLLSAFIFMFGLVLSANFFADSVRDAFDPRLRVIKHYG